MKFLGAISFAFLSAASASLLDAHPVKNGTDGVWWWSRPSTR